MGFSYRSVIEPKIDRVVHFVDFWSDVDALVTLDTTAGDEELPDVVVAGIPSGATLDRVVLIFKYSAREDTSGSANDIDGAQVISVDSSSGRDSVVTAINLPDTVMATAASSKEGGDVIIGDNDVKAEVTGDGTYYITWELAEVTGDDLKIYDVQVGLRVYFH